MIVNPTTTGWEVIYQRAHALLAGDLASHWRADQRPARWFETLAAITQHDDGGREWEGGNHLTEAGAPLDFRLSPFALIQPSQVATDARYQGRWVAMLISMHMSFLYESHRGEDGEVDAWLDEQLAWQKRWRGELSIPKREAEAAYALVQFCDRLSLILCGRGLPVGERSLEIAKGVDGERHDIMQREDGTLVITPWPFEDRQFTVQAEATYLDRLRFDSDDDLREALMEGRIETLTWTFARSGS
jgi:hypothetical protein